MQLPISFDPPHNGTATSAAAAHSMRDQVSILREKIVAYIERLGACGSTCDEIEVALGLSHQCCSARITELHAPRTGKPRIYDSGRTRKTRSGRAAIVWRIFP